MKAILYSLIGLVLFSSCGNSTDEKIEEVKVDTSATAPNADTASDASLVEKSEALKASIEAMAPSLQRKEVVFKDSKANASIKQKWEKMDVYSDSTGMVYRIKLYSYKNISNRYEEFYFDKEQLFFVFIADDGKKEMENKDEGQPGKEFHFSGSRLLKYDDKSGDKETNITEEKAMYETTLPMEAKEYMELAKNK